MKVVYKTTLNAGGRGPTLYTISVDKRGRFHAHEILADESRKFAPQFKAFKLNPMRRYKNRWGAGYSYPGVKRIGEARVLISQDAKKWVMARF